MEKQKQKSDYELYLERFCKSHNVEPEDAEKMAIVKETKKCYEEGGNQ